jgi:hypothetical protein
MKNLPIYLLRKEEEGGTGAPPVIVSTGGRCSVSAQASGALRQPQGAWASRQHRSIPVGGTPTLLDNPSTLFL